MIRFGIIGTNWITEAFIEAAQEIKEFKLTAVYSRNSETAASFAEKHGVEHTFTILDEFTSSEHMDAVYIASPNSLHAQQAISCMDAGKHVICEKPLASNSKEVAAMMEAAKRNDVILMEAMKTIYLPNFLAIKDNLHKIGKVRKYIASYCQYSSRYDKFKEGTILNAFKPEFSNGALMDIGVYTIFPMVVLFGMPKQIQANSYKLHTGVDGQGSIVFHYEEMDATVHYSKIANSHLPTEIQGENGSILIDKIHTPENVKIVYRNGIEEDISVPQKSKSMYYEAKEFIDAILLGNKETVDLSRSFHTATIMEEARKQTGIIYPADTHK